MVGRYQVGSSENDKPPTPAPKTSGLDDFNAFQIHNPGTGSHEITCNGSTQLPRNSIEKCPGAPSLYFGLESSDFVASRSLLKEDEQGLINSKLDEPELSSLFLWRRGRGGGRGGLLLSHSGWWC